MLMPIKVFADLISKIKAFRCDIVYIKDDLILGTDEFFYIAKRIWLDYSIDGHYIFNTTRLVEFAKNTVDLGADEVVTFNPETATIESTYGIIEGIKANNYILSILNLKNNARCLVSNSNPTLIVKDLKDMDKFNEIMNMKATEGSDVLIVDNKYPMTIYKGLIPLNKSDKIELHIYDNDPRYFSAVFYIMKPKYTIEIFTRYAKL